ncbi:MAG: Major cardiolipin synthase ClsA [candidate division BRC1 bacterium ADurb.BinA292]|nr:MAG: Major cardiolipin synthase ClsA [candidate division BRC1 bacterium ADurb.BinA292]
MTRQKYIAYRIESLYGVEDAPFRRAMGNLLGPPLVAGNRLTELCNGDQIFPAMLAAIAGARETITFETYIYWSGEIGRRFAEALAERAHAGVRVHVILDWFGARIESTYIDQMERAGVQIVKYHPLRWFNLSRLNYRTHRKLLVIDGRIGFTGGVGIADEWTGDAQDPDHWRDMHYQLEGPAVAQLQAAFMDNWIKTSDQVLHGDAYFKPAEPAGDACCQVFKSSPNEGSSSVRLMYLFSLAAARRHVRIANSYFVPDEHAQQELVRARERGVAVDIILPGGTIDYEAVRRASRANWGPLLEAGVRIWEYQPTMYHCKVMIVDDCWVSVGSTNLDNRSFRLNDEANLNIHDREFAARQVEIFERDRERSREVSLEEWRRRPLREKALEHFLNLFRSQL